MKIAYAILAHKNPGQLARMIAALAHPDVTFFIHVDKCVSDQEYKQNIYSTVNPVAVFFTSKRVRVYHGGFSIVQATLKLIEEIVTTKINVDYIVLISGQDYPIQSNEGILKFFDHNFGKEFIGNISLPCPGWDIMSGYERYWPGDIIKVVHWMNGFTKSLNRSSQNGNFPFQCNYMAGLNGGV
jgi:hypothetical protein